jgi:hypothetical protein
MCGFARGFFEPLALMAMYPSEKLAFSIAFTCIFMICPVPTFLWVAKYTDRKEKDNPKIRPLIVGMSLLCTSILFPIMYFCGLFPLSII